MSDRMFPSERDPQVGGECVHSSRIHVLYMYMYVPGIGLEGFGGVRVNETSEGEGMLGT